MATFLLIIHVLICFSLIFIVLIQGGKGAQMGAAFGGGSSQTLFGGRGGATFLGKATTGVAIVFMLTSMLLAMASVRGTSIIKSTPASSAPAAPMSAIPESAIPATEMPAAPSPAPAEAPRK